MFRHFELKYRQDLTHVVVSTCVERKEEADFQKKKKKKKTNSVTRVIMRKKKIRAEYLRGARHIVSRFNYR